MRTIGVCALLLGVAAIAPAQTMVETAAAAAGGSAAGAAGQQVGKGIDKVFGKLGTIADAASERKGRLAPNVPPEPRVKGVTPVTEAQIIRSSRSARQPVRRGFIEPAAVAPPPPEPMAQAAAPVQSRPEPTPADLQSLSQGSSREDVIGKMGAPAARITLQDERGLVETYSYRGQGSNLGSVRLINGKVSEVRPANQ